MIIQVGPSPMQVCRWMLPLWDVVRGWVYDIFRGLRL